MSAEPHPQDPADASKWPYNITPERWQEIVGQLNFNAFVEPIRKLRREMEAELADDPAAQPITEEVAVAQGQANGN